MELAANLHFGESLGDRLLKVDHAGEHGAVNIYRAQALVCRWRSPALVPDLLEFRRHEERHREIFRSELERRGVRRCRSYHLCGLGGFALGFVTALCGPAVIGATTAAVEEVVLRHLERQQDHLRGTDAAAFTAVAAIVEDERAHQDHGERIARRGRFWPRVVRPVVAASTEAVIWLGMKL